MDWKQYDGNITLAVNRRKGIWASSSLLKSQPTTRQAGNVGSTDLSSNNLFAIALANALRSVGAKQREQITGKDRRKVRLLVTLENSPSSVAFIQGMQGKAESHVAANFRQDVQMQTSKYDLTFETDGAAYTSILERWAEATVSPVNFLPRVFQRQAFQQRFDHNRKQRA